MYIPQKIVGPIDYSYMQYEEAIAPQLLKVRFTLTKVTIKLVLNNIITCHVWYVYV